MSGAPKQHVRLCTSSTVASEGVSQVVSKAGSLSVIERCMEEVEEGDSRRAGVAILKAKDVSHEARDEYGDMMGVTFCNGVLNTKLDMEAALILL